VSRSERVLPHANATCEDGPTTVSDARAWVRVETQTQEVDMSRRHTLKGRRIAVFATDGFEKVELTVPVRALRAAGAKVDVVSLRRGRIRGLNLNLPATRVRVDKTVEQVGAGDYDGLLVPGGFINPDLLRQSAPARGLVREFVESGKPVVTLCHGPWVLASAGVLQGRTLTSWAGIRDDVVNAGATWLDQEVVREGNLTTSRGPQDMVAFIPAMLETFAEGPLPATTFGLAPRSGPQRSSPPDLVSAATRWSPKPSTVALAGVGLAALARRTARRTGARGRTTLPA
jgi:protease I